MNCLDYELQIDDYADGTLDATARAALEAHLRECPSCRALVADFRTLRAATRDLPQELPAPHVWTRIAAAVDAEQRRGSRWRWFDPGAIAWQPALSAAALVAVLVAGSWLAFRDASAPHEVHPAMARVNPAASSPIEPVGTTFTSAEAHYTNAIASLEQITNAQSDALDRPTATVVQQNLAVVDHAIVESRAALQKEPASDVAQESLFDALQTKLTLLQQTVDLINDTGKGHQ